MTKSKLKKKKSSYRLPLIISLVIILLGVAVIFAKSMVKKEVAMVAEVTSSVGSCSVNFSLNRPSPVPSPTPTPTGTSVTASSVIPSPTVQTSVCDIRFNLPDQAVCWKEPRTVDISYTVHSLPPGGPYYVITDWFNASPFISQNNYYLDESKPLEVGKTYTMQAQWPGIPTGETRIVEIHAGLQVVPNKYELLQPNCTGAIDYYWTPYVKCP